MVRPTFNLLVCLVPLVSAFAVDRTYHESSQYIHSSEDAVLRETFDKHRVEMAMNLLVSMGVPRENLCTATSSSSRDTLKHSDELDVTATAETSILPLCVEPSMKSRQASLGQTMPLITTEVRAPYRTQQQSWIRSRRERYLSDVVDGVDGEDDKNHDDWFYIRNGIFALACVTLAALAAGLTTGLLSLDPLMLLIKVRAAETKEEQEQAASLLPIVRQHHLLLVTLLLSNSLANEALPLFLEVLVSPLVSVILSVTLVLFFGEIIPNAIFTGPNKLKIASRMVPMVKVLMVLLWPLAFPIAKLLDAILHDDDQESGDEFGRGELTALVRIQYEERMANKKRRKQDRESTRRSVSEKYEDDSGMVDNVGALDFASTQAIKASKKTANRMQSKHPNTTDQKQDPPKQTQQKRTSTSTEEDDPVLTREGSERSTSIHVDEVSMVEGALSMKTKVALDVYTPWHRIVAIPYDMILTEQNLVAIYSCGYSRIPVFKRNPDKPKSTAAICGVLKIKQLVVVNPNEGRPLSTLPLSCPTCVSPKMNLVDLLNMFQTGRAGHLALVCARHQVAQEALNEGKALPDAAGLMGIITLEDVLESLLQEQIYDESDKYEREANRIAQWATTKWKAYVRQRKQERTSAAETISNLSMGAETQEVMNANENSSLLPNSTSDGSQSAVFDPIGGVMQFFGNLTKKKS